MSARWFCAALLSAGLVAAGPGHAASITSCVKKLKTSAVRAGVDRALVAKALSNVEYDEKVVRFSRRQPEYRTPIWDYMAFLVDPERIETGQLMLQRHGRLLAKLEKAYGVDRYTLVALWGVESDYGQLKGDFFLPHALANLVCSGRKPKYFRGELIVTLKLAGQGDVKLDDLQGSWAGAFGQTQFMPSTYRRLAVDFDGDGRRDLVNSVPDALASSANFLRKAGWKTGQAWGYEVRLPKRYRGPSGRKRRASLATWRKRGVRKINGARLTGKGRAALIRPAGKSGPAFLVFTNFNALYSYNAATSYALAISHLADRLQGAKPFHTAWPVTDPGLSRKQRLTLQKRLLAAGYDIGEADGRIGPVTRAAIKQAQKKHGMKPTGRPSQKIYKALEPAKTEAAAD